ncbi:hypothetical protein PF006_g6804 [Phytophthora fragariae]|uniref:SET domain-containing protein n=1 Tax=Phytophthora fragariae TaxID=53985 RepID=A0A6A3UAT1_9STRA|nr:hypothetical protein PF006_g6804 [Phytophthora fragariae]
MKYRAEVHVAAVTTRALSANEELTVSYGKGLWFDCRCGADTCIPKKRITPRRTSKRLTTRGS